MALAVLAGLMVVFHLEENWRGRSAWEDVKKRLEAQQEKLDWAAYLPPAAPDEQNFFKAPGMEEWFTGKGSNELTARLALNSFAALTARLANSNASAVVAELILRPPGGDATTPGVDAPPAALLPVVGLDPVSLSAALGQLARRAGLKAQIDPALAGGKPGPEGKPGAPIYVTGRWTNVSALSVLMALQCNHNLRWEEDAKTGQPVIKEAGEAEAANREFVLGMIRAAVGPVGEIADGFPLCGLDLQQTPPRRLSVAPDSVPTRNELARLFPGSNAVQVEPAGNSLHVMLTHVPVAAADYLAWSERFSAEFDKMREAVKRPAARLAGDYEGLYRIPTPNVTAFHAVASRLASRAMAWLMRNRPEEALRELTLLRELRGCLEGRPAGQPVALAAATTDMAITVMYVETIDYGLRWQIWREPELGALQDQLSGMDPVSVIWGSMESERAEDCHLLESAPRAEAGRDLGLEGASLMALKLMPRGWIWQNMARLAEWDQKMIDAVDRLQGVIRPHLVDEAGAQTDGELRHRTLYSYLAKNAIHLMNTPLKSAALAQTEVNQALAVCALERCRLARGEYPATLRELSPQFLSLLAVDPVNGEGLHYRAIPPGRFLLYSVGWDEKDDNGAALDAKGNGDWVWGRL